MMLLSTALLLEYEAVCQREEHRNASGLTTADVGTFLDGLAVLAEAVEVHLLWRPQLRDAGDEMVLEAAVNGQARAIVAFTTGTTATGPPASASCYCCRPRPSGGLRYDHQDGTYPLRLPLSLKAAVEKLAKQDGTSVNQFVVVAVAEKLSAMAAAAADQFANRRARANMGAFDLIMNRDGGEPPRSDDTL